MSDKQEKKQAKKPSSPNLPLGDLMQYMVRPVRELEVRMREMSDEFDQDIVDLRNGVASARKYAEDVEQKLEAVQNAAQKGLSECLSLGSRVKPVEKLVEDMKLVKDSVDECVESARVGELLRNEVRRNAKEIAAQDKKLASYHRDMEKVEMLVKASDASLKDRLDNQAGALKDLMARIAEVEGQSDVMHESYAKLDEELGHEVDNIKHDLIDRMDRNVRQVEQMANSVENDVDKQIREMKAANMEAVNEARAQMREMADEFDMLGVMRKEMNVLERRMDKMVAVVKELKAHFEFGE